MKLLNPIIDKLQAALPPNRVAILLAGLITAVSGSIAAWLAAHFPGLNFGSAEIAGVLGAAVIVTVRLLDRWFDRWQAKEQTDYGDDIQVALDELAGASEVQAFLEALGTFDRIGQAIAQVRDRIGEGSINEAEIDQELATLAVIVDGFLRENRGAQPELEEPEVAAVAPAAE